MNLFDRNRWVLLGLMKEAQKHASEMIEHDGHCPPFLLIQGKKGNVKLKWDGLIKEEHRIRPFVEEVKERCKQVEVYATAYVFSAMVRAHPTCPSSPHGDDGWLERALIIQGETRDLRMKKHLPLLMEDKGQRQLAGFGWPKVYVDVQRLFSEGIEYNGIEGTIQFRSPWMVIEAMSPLTVAIFLMMKGLLIIV